MTKTALVNNVTRTFHKVGFTLKQHSPEILIAAGVVGTIASVVMACKATTKINDILEKANEDIEVVHNAMEYPENLKEEYTGEDGKKDLAIIYVKTGFELAKLYAPAVALGTLSLASIITSNHIHRTRNMALAAAYTAVDKGFKEYRGRVVERFGEALDRELRYNIKAKEVEEVVINEDGTEQTVKKTIEVVDAPEYSDYARFFDNGCLGWEKDSEFNLFYLKKQQDLANEMLRANGHLFLNDVYDMLGIPRTRAGHIVGWVYDDKNPTGDNYVDFGIYDTNKPRNRDFVNGYERVILLDFNVDGNILNRIY